MKQLTARSLADTDRQVRADVEAVQPVASRSLRSLFSRAQHSYRQRLTNQLESSVLAAMATMRQFSGQPGRKVMLLLAGGWPRSVAIYTRANLPDGGLPRDRRIMSEDDLYGPLVSTANLIGFSLYPVDVPGPMRGFGGDASRGFRANAAIDPADASAAALEREDTVHSTLHLLARSTGGVPLVNFRRDVALASVVADTRSYYWLGFEPRRREDDRFHQIEVRLAGRADLNARTREGYVDMSRDHELDMTAKAALLFGDPPDALPARSALLQAGSRRPPQDVGQRRGGDPPRRDPAAARRRRVAERGRGSGDGDGRRRQPLRSVLRGSSDHRYTGTAAGASSSTTRPIWSSAGANTRT